MSVDAIELTGIILGGLIIIGVIWDLFRGHR